jgi:DNA polymerase IV
MERCIIHLNVADFAVAVERALDARLKRRPVIIAPGGSARAAVYDMSEEAYLAGIRKGMTLRKAVRLCTDAWVLPPHPDRYERAMHALIKQALPYSPLVEPGERDGHLFVDVTGTRRLFGAPVDIAWLLRKYVKADLNLDPIWAVAPNKLLAKVATRLVKPTGECIVEAGAEETFLAPLPVRLIPGIERGDLIKLQAFNLTRVSQVAALGTEHLAVPFGSRAHFIYETVRGVDRSPVSPVGKRPPQIIIDHILDTDTNDITALNRALYGMIEAAGRGLRRQCLASGRIGIILDHSDGVRRIRNIRTRPATADDSTLFQFARDALKRVWTRRVRIRHIRLIFDKLVFPPAQRELFPTECREMERRTDLVNAIDKIRDRYGHKAVQMGRMLAA